MPRFSLITAGVLGLALLALLSGSVAAQNATASSGAANETYIAQIDGNVKLVDYRYDASSQTFIVELESDVTTLVAISDAFGPFAESGVSTIPMKRTTIPEGRSTLRMQVSEWDGRAAVSIATANAAVAVSTGDVGSGLFSGSPSWDTVRVAGASGFAGGLVIVGYMAYSRVRTSEGMIEREL